MAQPANTSVLTNVANAQVTNVANTSKNTFSSMTDSFKSATSSNLGVVVIAGVLFFVIVYVMVYIYQQYNSTSLKTVTMLKKPTKVPTNSLLNISINEALPELYNGKEFSYSAWMYVDGDNLENTTSNKFVMGRMDSKGNIATATPLIVLDKSLNKLYVYIKKVNSNINNINDIPDVTGDTTLTISYLPLQRWVNIIIVVDNNFMQLFMDGELREVKDLTENQSMSQNSSVITTPVGNIMVGSANNLPAFNGYLSKVQAFNYAVTIDHAKVIYKAGPLHKSILSTIGVPYYGVQSPFYRIDENIEVDGNCST